MPPEPESPAKSYPAHPEERGGEQGTGTWGPGVEVQVRVQSVTASEGPVLLGPAGKAGHGGSCQEVGQLQGNLTMAGV